MPTLRFLLAAVAIPTILAVSLSAGSAFAQQESAAAAMPRPEPPAKPVEITVVGEPKSPTWTQGRSFAATRVWLLDPGEQEFELWYSTRISHNGTSGDNPQLWQIEYMKGVAPHVQLDVYFNYQHDDTGFHIEGAQIEGRFSLARHYGETWGNPALYLEWHPQTRGPNRGEVRLLIGGQIFSPNFHGAFNPFLEQNLDSGPDGKFSADREIGASAAFGYAIIPGMFSLGAELKGAADQQDEKDYKGVFKVGPSLWLNLFDSHFRITYAGLIGVTKRSDAFNPFLVLGYTP
jgi:hypothetical protein